MLTQHLRRLSAFFSKEITTISTDDQSLVRLSKWISMKSLCSRRQAEQFIKLGLVRIDGKRIYENMMVPYTASMKAFTPQGLQLQKPVTRLWMLNKPRGCICSHNDPQKRTTIYNILPPQFSTSFGYLMSVGRLDYNSEGLLLLTNDNILKRLLENPINNLTRFYRVKVHGRVTESKLQKMNRPMQIKGQPYGPLHATVDRSLSTNAWLNISLKTGKNREIRRILQKCDLQVNKLIREQYGPYKLNSLPLGSVQELGISPGLEKKMKLEKAKQLSQNSNCLIEIDIRQKAIEFAVHEKAGKQISENGQATKKIKPSKSEKHQDFLAEQSSSDD